MCRALTQPPPRSLDACESPCNTCHALCANSFLLFRVSAGVKTLAVQVTQRPSGSLAGMPVISRLTALTLHISSSFEAAGAPASLSEPLFGLCVLAAPVTASFSLCCKLTNFNREICCIERIRLGALQGLVLLSFHVKAEGSEVICSFPRLPGERFGRNYRNSKVCLEYGRSAARLFRKHAGSSCKQL